MQPLYNYVTALSQPTSTTELPTTTTIESETSTKPSETTTTLTTITSTTASAETTSSVSTVTVDIESTTEPLVAEEIKELPTDSDNEIMLPSSDSSVTSQLKNSNVKLRRSSVNLVELNRIHEGASGNRIARSIVDYMITRYYDTTRFYPRMNPRPHIPTEQPSFLVYGKYREYNIDFMRYDTVLPFSYIPHLDTIALRFPLDNTNYYLLLLLPVNDYGIDQLICNLRLNGSLRYIIGNLKYQHVIATIPSFMLKGYVTLTPTFQKVSLHNEMI